MRLPRCLPLFCAVAALAGADLEPGLVAAYYEGAPLVDGWPALDQRPPTLVRVEPAIDYASVEGQFARTKLSDNFAARWTGILRIDQAGTYGFATQSDDGSRLLIDGATVVDNGGSHGFVRQSGVVELAAGDHPIQVDFFEGGGGAGCRVLWTPPGGQEQPLAAERLLHDPATARIAWDEAAWTKRKIQPGAIYTRMDYGPFLSASVELAGPHQRIANKGLAIKLRGADEDELAGVLFDTDLLQYAAGWTGGFLQYRGVAFEGNHGPNPAIDGELAFSAPAAPGWARDGSFADPRPQPFGPLPRAWGRWRGLHLDGQRVTLNYDVGTANIVESPALISAGTRRGFARALDVGAGAADLQLFVCDVGGAEIAPAEPDRLTLTHQGRTTVVAIAGKRAPGVRLRAEGGRVLLDVPAAGARLTLVIWHGAADQRDAAMTGLLAQAPAADQVRARSTKAGAPRWTTPLTTVGQLGAGDGAYVVDTLTLPDDNPWSAWMRPGGVDAFADGRIAISTWSGDVWVVSGVDDALQTLTWKRFATGLFQPLGLRIVDDVVYAHGRDQITRLKDLDADGEADVYECFNNDVLVTPNFHEFAFDLHTDADGAFYFIKGGPVRPGGGGFDTLTPSHGCVFKLSPDGEKTEVYATGVRAPNGMGVGPNGEVTSGDNQGTWTPACRLNLMRPGGFYGVVDLAHRDPPPTDYDRPLCWLPMGVDNSSGAQVWVPEGGRWGPLGGQLLHLSYGSCSLFAVLKERIGEQWQGGVVRFPLGFASGIMRARFSAKDGQLYVCGLKGWQTTAQRDGCLQRVRATGTPARMPIAMATLKTGLAITYSDPLDPDTAADPANYRVQCWNYKWTSNYGSPDFKPSAMDQEGRDTREVTAATLSPDGRTVTLAIAGMAPVMQQQVTIKIASADGEVLEHQISHTIHALPDR